MDINGLFYLIHPNENMLIRHPLTNEIINVKEGYEKYFKKYFFSNNVYSCINVLIKINYLIYPSFNEINLKTFMDNVDDIDNFFDKNILLKTTFSRLLNSNIYNYEFYFDQIINSNFIKTLILSYKFNLHYIILIMNTLLSISTFKLKNINYIYNDDYCLKQYYLISIKILDYFNKNDFFNKINNINTQFFDEKLNYFIKTKHNSKINIDLLSVENYRTFDSLIKKNYSHDEIINSINMIILNNDLYHFIDEILKQLKLHITNENITKLFLDILKNNYKLLQKNIKNKDFKWFNDNFLIDKLDTEYDNVRLCYYYGFVYDIIDGNKFEKRFDKYIYLYKETQKDTTKYICYEPIFDYSNLFMVKPFIFNLFNNSINNINNKIKLYFNSSQIMRTIYDIDYDINKKKISPFDYPNDLHHFLLILLKKIQKKFNI